MSESILCVQLDSTAVIILTTLGSIFAVLLFCILPVLLQTLSRLSDAAQHPRSTIPPPLVNHRSAMPARRRIRAIRAIQSRSSVHPTCRQDCQSLPSSSPVSAPKTRKDASVQCDDSSSQRTPKTRDASVQCDDSSNQSTPQPLWFIEMCGGTT